MSLARRVLTTRFDGPLKEPPFPLDVPVSVKFPDCKNLQYGVIKQSNLNGHPSYSFWWSKGRNKGSFRQISPHHQDIFLETGEEWEYHEPV